jgi:hypothetical protein
VLPVIRSFLPSFRQMRAAARPAAHAAGRFRAGPPQGDLRQPPAAALGSVASDIGGAWVGPLRRLWRVRHAQGEALRGGPVDHADLKAMLDVAK